MLQITYAPDGATSWTGGTSLVLCNTSRPLAELDVKFNHKRLLTPYALYGAAQSLMVDYGNIRNTLSLKVRRALDFSSTAFPDPEGALAFALQQPAQFATTGALQIKLVGTSTTVTLYLLNCGVEGLSLADWLGNAPAFDYTFNGGLITTTSPF